MTIIVLIFRIMFPDHYYFLVAAVFGVVGHNWPIYYKFSGGAGISAIYGGFLAVDPLGAVVSAFSGLLLGMVVLKDIITAYISGPWLMVLWLWFRTHDPAYVIYALIVDVLFVVALLPEIKDQWKKRREGNADFDGTMKSFPMGRGMLKMMEKLHISKK